MIAIGEKDVAMDARWCLLEEHRRKAALDCGIRVLTSQEAWHPERFLHHAIAPERRHTEVGEADQVILGLLDFAFPGVIVTLVHNNSA